MPGAHARLAPSAASRWIACPASIRMAEKAEKLDAAPPDSPYAAEGTKAHELAEIEASFAFDRIGEREYRTRWDQATEGVEEDTLLEMEPHVQAYVALIRERALLYPGTQVYLEQRMASGVPNCWGTSDAVLVSPYHVEIIDLKYGAGIAVDALDNAQLRLYALGALDTFSVVVEPQTVYMTVFQPRLNSTSTEELTADELRAWRAEVALPAARSALTDPDAPFGPSYDTCRFCPAAGICAARTTALAEQDFGEDPEVLSAAETGEWLKRVPEIRNWCSAIEDAALRRAYKGEEPIPGFKVVLSGGNRSITDFDAAVKRLVAAGFGEGDITRTQLQTLGHLEKLVGKDRLPQLLDGILVKPEGKPALAPEDDKRPPIDRHSQAAKDFA